MSAIDSEESEDDLGNTLSGSRTELLIKRLTTAHTTLSHVQGEAAAIQLSKAFPRTPPGSSLEAQVTRAGVTSPFNTWHFEDALRQQVSSAVNQRHLEIDAYEAELSDALADLARVRSTEEARLAARVAESTSRFQARLEALQLSYLAEVEKLRRQTVEELAAQRAQSEAAVASRVRALQGRLRHERPAGLAASAAAAAMAAAATAAATAVVRFQDSAVSGNGSGGSSSGTSKPASPRAVARPLGGSPARPYSGMRMRSSATARGMSGSPGPIASPRVTTPAKDSR